MTTTLGSGNFKYEVIEDWAQIPDGWSFTDVAAVAVDHKDRVYVSNGYGNSRVHKYSPDGKPIKSWGQPGTGPGEVPNLGPRISIVDNEGQLLARFGAAHAGYDRPDQFVAPHGMAVDSHGDIYVGEVSFTAWPQIYPNKEIPKGLRTLRKLVRVC